MAGFRRILYGTDFSANAERAFEVARKLAEELNATLYVLNVVSGGEQIAASAGSGWLPFVDRLRQNLDSQYCSRTTCEHQIMVRKGDPARTIVEVAEQEGADLIIIGARGAGTLGRLLGEGSVADKVLKTSHLPVVVVPRD